MLATATKTLTLFSYYRKLVLISVQDASAKKMTEIAYETMKRVGATNPLKYHFRSSYALLGYSGPGKLDAVTQVMR